MTFPEKRVTFINSNPSTAIAESITHMPNPLDPNAPPIRIKKKPGRKPNPASPALRKAQNRAAQRAFRERKERHLKELEESIKTLKDNQRLVCAQLESKIQEKQAAVDSLQRENEYLKGFVLSLQVALSQHGIKPSASSLPDAKACNADFDSGIESAGLNSPVSRRDSSASSVSPAVGFENIGMTSVDIATASSSTHAFLDTVNNNDFPLIPNLHSLSSSSPDFLDSSSFSDFLTSSNASPKSDSFTEGLFGDEFSDEMSLIDPISSATTLLSHLVANESNTAIKIAKTFCLGMAKPCLSKPVFLMTSE